MIPNFLAEVPIISIAISISSSEWIAMQEVLNKAL
jgi:hypothetical protein